MVSNPESFGGDFLEHVIHKRVHDRHEEMSKTNVAFLFTSWGWEEVEKKMQRPPRRLLVVRRK